ncbi:MAG TPA: FAD-binding protein, partial [Actinomycetota bacterium]|nr:FAD-binding protein [Actinomycetota bacterium]
MPDLEDAERLLRERLGSRLRVGFPLAPLTSFRIGGPAALFVEAEDDGALGSVGQVASQTGASVAVIGKGSNVLVSDEGFPGIVVRLGKGYRWAGRDGDLLTAGGAMPLPALAGVAMRHRLAGLEFGVAIPASLGGAVKMNAGAHGRSMSEVIE